jgi:hypothetical protein
MSGAEDLVRTIGVRIGMEENSELMNLICNNMKHEFVLEEWQLASLDSYQWQSLGAPIGLAAAVRTLTASAAMTPAAASAVAPTGQLPSMISTSSVLNETGLHTSQKASSWMKVRNNLGSSLRSSSAAQSVQHINPIAEAADEESGLSNNSEQEKATDHDHDHDNADTKNPCRCGDGDDDQPPVSPFTLIRSLNAYEKSRGALGTIFTDRSFPMTSQFQKALIHAKSGADLKAHTVFVMELNVLASALFFGAGVELWGSFPMDFVGRDTGAFVPQNLALVYHLVSCANLIIQLVCTSGWIWSIHATAAVSPNKFHMFFVQTRYAFDNFLFFSEFGQILLVLNITLLLGAQVAATTSNQVWRMIGFYAPILFTLLGCRFVHTLSSYVGRVAYHGLLLMDDDPEAVGVTKEDDSTIQKDGSAAKAEFEISKTFNKHNIHCEDSVLDVYRKAKATPDDDAVGMSMFDDIFPGSKAPPPREQPREQKEG